VGSPADLPRYMRASARGLLSVMLDFRICANALASDVKTARQLLGAKAIIGASVSSIEEAAKAIEDGADYLGIGTVFQTSTYLFPA
jgi:hypothetical protein